MPLRLKALDLQGYKTFAEKTSFEFAEGITAIVGPNGSGKSNIADALRWVLGEQSYSLLRAKKTEDMIFAGSEQRSRAGMATATITFDNADNWLPVDFAEVALARRAYRDSGNEYLLNGQRVRLKDVNELLSQSGLSERTYTILGQGLVDASLALKADDRRRLFEEAAGIGLYRGRREDALRRLEKTGRNLERVLDVMTELSPLIRRLGRQAKRAKEHAQVQEDLQVLLRDWYGYHWNLAQKELAQARQVFREQDKKLREVRGSHEAQLNEVTAFRTRIQELRAQLNTWHRESSELHNKRETISRELAVLDERRRSLQASQENLLTERELSHDEERIAQERLEAAKTEYARLKGEDEEARTEIKKAQSALSSRRAERAEAEKALQDARQQLNRLGGRRAQLQAHLDSLENSIAAQKDKIDANERTLNEVEEKALQTEKEAERAQKARQKAEEFHQNAEEAFTAQQEKTEKLEKDRRSLLASQAERETSQSKLKAQFEVLEQAEESLSGYAEGARFLLEAARKSQLKESRGALSAALDVPAEIETAIAAALGEYIDAILLASEDDAEAALQLLENEKAGRAALLPLAWLATSKPLKAPKDADCLGIASEMLTAPDGLQEAVDLLLGQTLIVKDRAAARRLLKGMDGRSRAVTLRGEIFRADGLVLAGGANRSGTLSRPRQRRELQAALQDVVKRLAELAKTLTRLTSDLDAAKVEESRLGEAARAARTKLEEARKAEQQATLDAESARRQAEWQLGQREQLKTELTRAEADREESIQGRENVQGQEKDLQARIRTFSTKLAELSLDELQTQVTYWQTRVAVSERALSDAEARRREREQALTRLKSGQENLQRRETETASALENLDAQKEKSRIEETALNENLTLLQEKLKPAEVELQAAETEEAERRSQETDATRQMTTAERQHGQMQMDVTRRQEAMERLRQQIEDDFGLVMFSYEENVSGPMPLPFEGMVQQLSDLSELPEGLGEQVKQERARLRRMGPVNPEAQEEFEKESKRHDFMEQQIADLRKAESDLREVIRELDELTEQAFVKTFKVVALEFTKIFIRLFGGGSAKLSLTDPDNLVETGIEIEARLPGRREQSLGLLSGGERSLTAIALVFALLRVSPTPVCVMDEVDAMLDEANVGRFREMLTELSKDVQFIVITHNRNTVQAADVIYGVTMGRDSSSQIISLKLDEVSDEMLGAR
ncbi:MAG: chromosome segregation protein SMC [Anaerolineae bacterium]|jgi:chromosome segregation protein|nr:chromosome segregation protein SMC [Anaerolineae bacterium]MBT7069813.1 chromosome segregation protein SMC [Anaerolineae bacterium]MBT7326694.1 chromosome segregation protein SMC [Anaerolineae bacterium]